MTGYLSAIEALASEQARRKRMPGRTLSVLDHGRVQLVDYMGDDRRVCEAARVIVDAPWRKLEDPKLIRYMLKNGHTSPFEHVQFTFYIKAPIFVFRQWHRHRMWSYNELSARYKELPEEYYVPRPDQIGTQSASNHQSRLLDGKCANAEGLAALIDVTCHKAFDEYKYLLKNGVPRELARGVLPFNTYSEMFATVDLHNLMHFLRLRLDEHAQHEIRVYAEAMLSLIEPVVPTTIAAFKEAING